MSIAYVHGPTTFNRPDLLDDTKDKDGLDTAIDDVDRVLTSLNYTTLLNELVDDGYLVKEFQGGVNPVLLDIGYDADRDTRNAAPYGNPSALHTVVDQVFNRENISADIEDLVENPYDFNEVRKAVNRAVGRLMLLTYSDPSKYRFTKETYGLVDLKLDENKCD